MTGDQYREAIATLGLNQTTAASLLEISPRNSRRYAAGELPVPPLLAMVLQLMIGMRLTVDDVDRYKERM